MKYKTQNNYVLIEINLDIKLGGNFMLDMTYNPELVPTSGIVRSVPSNLINQRDVDGRLDQDHHIEWVGDIDIKEGDVVVFDYLQAIRALGWKLRDILDTFSDFGNWQIIDNKLHIFLDYEVLYLRIRDGEIKTLNGYVIIEPLKLNNTFIQDKEYNLRNGICKYTGTPNHSYTDETKHIIMPKQGDEIVFMDFANIVLEPKYYGIFTDVYWVTQGYRVIGKLK